MKELNWSEIYEKESGKLLATLKRYVSDIETAEDILHESFIKAIQSASSIKNYGALEAWLKQLCINMALDFLRKNQNQSFIGIEDVQIADEIDEEKLDSRSKQNIANTPFSKEELHEIIDSLSIQQKTVFNLYVIDGVSHKDIAETLNISETASKTTLSRSRKRVQDLLLKKAQNKEISNKKRKGAFAVITTAIAGESFADTIFQQAFKNNFTATNLNLKPDFNTGLSQAKPLVIKSTLQVVKSASIIAASTGVAASVTIGLVAYKSHNSVSTPNITTDKIELQTEIIKNTDSLAHEATFVLEQNNTTTSQKDSAKKQTAVATQNTTMALNTADTADSLANKHNITNNDSSLQENAPSRKKVILKKKVYIKQ